MKLHLKTRHKGQTGKGQPSECEKSETRREGPKRAQSYESNWEWSYK